MLQYCHTHHLQKQYYCTITMWQQRSNTDKEIGQLNMDKIEITYSVTSQCLKQSLLHNGLCVDSSLSRRLTKLQLLKNIGAMLKSSENQTDWYYEVNCVLGSITGLHFLVNKLILKCAQLKGHVSAKTFFFYCQVGLFTINGRAMGLITCRKGVKLLFVYVFAVIIYYFKLIHMNRSIPCISPKWQCRTKMASEIFTNTALGLRPTSND